MMRLRSLVTLILVGFACLCGPHYLRADSQSIAAAREAEELAEKRATIRQKQITYGAVGAGVIGVITVIMMGLNSANRRGKEFANRHKRKRPLDEDAPLPYDAPPATEPVAE